MYLHFEDWSQGMFLEKLDQDGLPHAGRIIKVKASDVDPAEAMEKPDLMVLPVDGSDFFDDDIFPYKGRETYTGDQLEARLRQLALQDRGTRAVRALFRFGNRHGFCQAAMDARTETGWLIDHPFGDIDGIGPAQANPSRETGIHLDIFFPASIAVLRGIVDIDNPASMLTPREGIDWHKRQMAEPLINS